MIEEVEGVSGRRVAWSMCSKQQTGTMKGSLGDLRRGFEIAIMKTRRELS